VRWNGVTPYELNRFNGNFSNDSPSGWIEKKAESIGATFNPMTFANFYLIAVSPDASARPPFGSKPPFFEALALTSKEWVGLHPACRSASAHQNFPANSLPR
jgi:hypothetical protein